MTGWQWHQPNHMQIVCNSLQTDHHASTSSLHIFLQAGCPSCRPTNSVKSLKATVKALNATPQLYTYNVNKYMFSLQTHSWFIVKHSNVQVCDVCPTRQLKLWLKSTSVHPRASAVPPGILTSKSFISLVTITWQPSRDLTCTRTYTHTSLMTILLKICEICCVICCTTKTVSVAQWANVLSEIQCATGPGFKPRSRRGSFG